MNVPLTHSLDAHFYTDPAIFDDEMKGVLSRTWQYAGHAAEIPNVGEYFAFEIAGQNLFAIRGRDEVVRTFYNVNQHRRTNWYGAQATQGLWSAPIINGLTS